MTVKVMVPTALRQLTNDRDELQLDSTDVGSALKELVSNYPELKRYFYADNGRMRNFVNVYLNGEDIRYISGVDTPLKDGDNLMIVPSITGGSADSGKPTVSFSGSELVRYSRHLIMPEVGLEGQRALKNASVLLVGAGALGTPSAMYLAAAGVGRIGIVDFDVVEKSNLHRQVLFAEKPTSTGSDCTHWASWI